MSVATSVCGKSPALTCPSRIINPTTGKAITKIVEGREADVDIAVKAATKTFETTWGENVPGFERGKLLIKLATLIERDVEILAAIEALDNGKTFSMAKAFDVTEAAATFRYYGGWADKTHGKVIEVGNRVISPQGKMLTCNRPTPASSALPATSPSVLLARSVSRLLVCRSHG